MRIFLFFIFLFPCACGFSQPPQSCIDTSFRIKFTSGKETNYALNHLTTSDNGTLINSIFLDSTLDPLRRVSLLKLNIRAEVIWANKFFIDGCSFLRNKAIEMADGSIVVGSDVFDRLDLKRSLLIAKFDASGSLLWSKRLLPNVAKTQDNFFVNCLAEGLNGDLLVSAKFTETNIYDSAFALVSRISTTGALIWSKSFSITNQPFIYPAGIFYNNGAVQVVGAVEDDASTCSSYTKFFGMRLNYATGDLEQLKSYCYSEGTSSSGVIANDDDIHHSYQRLSNGNFALFGLFHQTTTANYSFYRTVFDTDFNLLSSKIFSIPRPFAQGNHQIRVLPDGRTYMSFRNSSNLYWAVLDSMDNFIRQRKIQYPSGSRVSQQSYYSGIKPGRITMTSNTEKTDSNYFEFFQLQDNDPITTNCLGTDTSFVGILPFAPSATDWHWNLFQTGIFDELPHTLIVAPITFTREEVCQQVSICNQVHISGPDTVCVANQPQEFIIHKNPGCNKRIEFKLDTAFYQSIKFINDSTYQVVFKLSSPARDSVWLHASAGECGTVMGSTLVRLIPVVGNVPLSNSNQLCPGTPKKLTPGDWFKNYLWQDGSTDSVFSARQPGTYYVTVEAFCGSIFSDTIRLYEPVLVSNHLAIKCNSDTVLIHAKKGWNNYNWQPNYNSIAVSDSSIAVFPGSSISYKVTATSTEGCSTTDSILVTVNHSRSIYLGGDTSFCQGYSLNADAGNGFNSYQWSTGATSQSILLNQPGSYFVKAVDNNGCISKDTIVILSIYPFPVVNIHNKTVLCLGENDTLYAGSGFSSYHWQDGSSNSYYHVLQAGKYVIALTNQYGCTNADSVVITKLSLPPANFIFTDTTICQDASLVLKPYFSFQQYHWSNGASTNSITVTDPGIYSLSVTDQNGCYGQENILVKNRDCLNKIYFPGGFTPNGDGKNDLFKPYVDGMLINYELSVYNRWGQVIFKTRNPAEGWRGVLKAQLQDSNVFVWLCNYQFLNQSREMIRGTVMLIR